MQKKLTFSKKRALNKEERAYENSTSLDDRPSHIVYTHRNYTAAEKEVRRDTAKSLVGENAVDDVDDGEDF